MLVFMREALNESTVKDFKLCRFMTDDSGRFATKRYRCIDGRDCKPRDIRNSYVDAMRVILGTLKYIAVMCLPWVFPAFVTVARKRRFAVIGPHLWRKLDGITTSRVVITSVSFVK